MNLDPNLLVDMSFQTAVIVLHEDASDSIILTQRSFHLKDHPGEICFPGGRWHANDVDLCNTALRELNEELGIVKHRVQNLRKLQIEKTLNGFVIHPWFGTIKTIHPFTASVNEVAKVIHLPLKEVCDKNNYQDISIERQGKVFTSCQFIKSEFFIWGATARIMKQLCE